ncbi:phage recombination protein Bet [Nonomuraea sp. PA05]|uniref:phage recombination protein Bet n=1 Tax=Nonomuraea sp. PA05 TaxID=2604466 RepID=UPI0011DC2220|nr:phage recombination protein Bet [Nonomuraea sp. PA05]TYB69653.1 phage recombination protein Bet [Nonomuraea sp. PA05]
MTVTDNLPAVQGSGALAIQPTQSMFNAEQRAVLASMGVDHECTNAELAGFIHLCQRRDLDPFLKQVYLIGRYDKRAGRKVFTPQTGIDGFRVIARRAADKSGIDYEYEDTVWFDADGAQHEVWLTEQPPVAAKVVVLRNGKRFSGVARFAAYVDRDRDGNPKALWKTSPDGQIEKCAEAKALRRAFPEDLGGMYSDVEMEHLDDETPRETIQGQTIRETVAAQNGDAEQADGMSAKRQRNQIVLLLSKNGITSPDLALVYMSKAADREIAKPEDLTGAEAAQVMVALNRGDFLDEPPFTRSAEDNPLDHSEDEAADSEGGQS